MSVSLRFNIFGVRQTVPMMAVFSTRPPAVKLLSCRPRSLDNVRFLTEAGSHWLDNCMRGDGLDHELLN